MQAKNTAKGVPNEKSTVRCRSYYEVRRIRIFTGKANKRGISMNTKRNLTENGGLRLCELEHADFDRVLEIARACAVRATRNMYDACHRDRLFRPSMREMAGEKTIKNILEAFDRFDSVLSAKKHRTGSSGYKSLLLEAETILKAYPEDHLFSPYGPIQAPFKESVEKFIALAVKTGKATKRKVFRRGIALGDKLIGCFTFDVKEYQIEGYPGKTTGDFGLLIDPDHRTMGGKAEIWRGVFSRAVPDIEKHYPYKESGLRLSATVHRLNLEMGHIWCAKNGFKDEGLFRHKTYGERRFFTIGFKDFVQRFEQGK